MASPIASKFRGIRLACVAHKSCEICETMRAQAFKKVGIVRVFYLLVRL
jgi:hypothetical protein